MTLTIQHRGDCRFVLKRGDSSGSPVTLADPTTLPVKNDRGEDLFSSLSAGLRWYFEKYCDAAYGENVDKAHRVMETLKNWGRESFQALFSLNTYFWYTENRNNLSLCIVSRDPAVLAWPWEALCDPENGLYLATEHPIERRVEDTRNHWTTPQPAQRLRMLLVIARPYGERDVDFFAVSKPVVEQMRAEGFPVDIDLLRPPTFQNLCDTLERAQRAGRPYHILHFDGHGGYGADPTGYTDRFQAAEGKLAFETAKPGEAIQEDLVRASVLGQLLQRGGVAMVVLNACQSAMVDGGADSAYASVAASLLRAGIPSVTAMGYSLLVTGAQQFVPSFYQALFDGAAPAEAMCRSRKTMFAEARNRQPADFQDWLVPQLYQSMEEENRILPQVTGRRPDPGWPNANNPGLLAYGRTGFLGRGRAVLELERNLFKPQAGLLAYGMAGAGKTTLIRGFLHWLRDTGGMDEQGALCPVHWFDFRSVQGSDTICMELASRFLPNGKNLTAEQQREAVIRWLREHRCFVVWDNFESVHELLCEGDRESLKALLQELRGGKSKVLLTSRNSEAWLGRDCLRLKAPLPGLQGQERWDYCTALAEEFGFTVRRNDKALHDLLDKLDGNPLAMRAVLPRLGEGVRPKQLLQDLESSFAGLEGEEATDRIRAAFRLVLADLRPEAETVLQLLGLHEHYADRVFLITMLWYGMHIKRDSPEGQAAAATVRRCLARLERSGFCSPVGKNVWQLHPALRSCLAQDCPAPEEVQRWFTVAMVALENHYHNDETQRRWFCGFHETNLRQALDIAKRLDMGEEVLSLLVDLAIAADDRGDLPRAEALWLSVAEEAEAQGNRREQDRAYSQLSSLTSSRGNTVEAQRWADKREQLYKDADTDAESWYARGDVADRRGDTAEAIRCFERALALWEASNDSRVGALYGILGNLAKKQGDFPGAKKRLLQAEEAAKGVPELLADVRRSLADLAEDEENWPEAEKQYDAALSDFKELGDRQSEADTLCMLGDLLIKKGSYPDAKSRFHEALGIYRNMDKRAVAPMIARCYEGLGNACAFAGQIPEARGWLQEAKKLFDDIPMPEDSARVQKKLDFLNQ